ncbi:hypothetical protein [Comamonas testosteroni]|nr:hypothetical protein [Comamonas testosteroni]
MALWPSASASTMAAGLRAFFYWMVAPKGLTYTDRDGEAIAVAAAKH